MEELRQFRRIPFQGQVRLGQGRELKTAELLNISLKGMLVRKGALPAPALGETVAAEIIPSPELTLHLSAQLTHAEADRLGFKFTDIDLDTIAHLRRLFELNTGEAEQTLEELFRWGK